MHTDPALQGLNLPFLMRGQEEASAAPAASKPPRSKTSRHARTSDRVAADSAMLDDLLPDAELGPRPQPMPVSCLFGVFYVLYVLTYIFIT